MVRRVIVMTKMIIVVNMTSLTIEISVVATKIGGKEAITVSDT